MLSPKRVKHRKVQKGRSKGLAWRGSDVSFGSWGLQALEPAMAAANLALLAL